MKADPLPGYRQHLRYPDGAAGVLDMACMVAAGACSWRWLDEAGRQ